MFHQILGLLIFLWSTDINPSTIKRITNYFFTLSNEFLHKMSSMEEGVFRNLCKGTFLDKVDTSIGIVVILGFLDKSLDIATVKIEDSEFDADIIRNSSYRHLSIMHLEVKKEVLIINVGEEIGVHHKNIIVVKSVHKLNATNSAKELRLTKGMYLYTITRGSKVLLDLLPKVVNSHIDMLHSIRNQTIHIMINDTLVSHFK